MRMRSNGAWRHECVSCGSIFFAGRCRIACEECYAAGRVKARGTCLLCGAKVPYHPRARNKGFLFCKECGRERALDSVRRTKKLHRSPMIVLTPTYEESDLA